MRFMVAAVVFLFIDIAHASCGSAYCLVNTQLGTQGAMAHEGSQLDLRYEYIHQDQLMSDDSKAKPEGVLDEHDEVSTVNRNWQLTYSYVDHDGWGISINAPIVSREHDHIHNDIGGPEAEEWRFTELGDVRVLGQFQLSTHDNPANSYGVIGGVKLPTGKTNIDNRDGEDAERTLQPGTGTTDIIVGAYYRQALDTRSGVFAQVLAQSAVNSDDHFKPGESLVMDVGYHFAATERVGLNAQLNYLVKWRDAGAQAEPAESGLRALFFSPGINYALTPSTQVYGFVQLPLYQNVNGTQLTADSALTAGVSIRF